MKSISKYYEQAELALAAYAVLAAGMSGEKDRSYTASLLKAGMTNRQAEHFASKYSVVDQFTHADYGLSVTVFEADGKKYLAIRGTNDLADLWTDFIDIVMRGTPELQKQYTELRKQVGKWMVDGVLSEGFTVAGHSLGGFLAGALFVDFPADIEHLYLYNTPGVGGYQAVIRQILGLEGASLNFLQASNIRADAGLSGIAGLGLSWGLPISIAIEDQSLIGVVTGESPMALNHSQQVLTDSLAVYALLEQLSPNMMPETFSAIWRSKLLCENPVDQSRVHFLGKVEYSTYCKALQVSAVHIYLTYPFVLSWSLLEALASGCLVIASDTEPVREVIRHGDNGWLIDFFDDQMLFNKILDILSDSKQSVGLRKKAQDGMRNYSINEGVKNYIKEIK